ncbi:MAG: ATP-dependent DNA helicase RecG, partial [Bacteroidaceae bacterium]|nr:ATP-dependent DNA helicase RecG [Bacteroidaceae bacterium]
AFLSCLIAIDNGFQACLMAPTEILAEQHFQTLSSFAEGLNVKVELLTGNVKGKQRKSIEEGLLNGSVHLLVGTHALIEPNVVFKNLGLCIIDEQHRFGVKQRAQLWKKNTLPPHVLVMTATPIPRTLAMTLYGDLDVSVIDELPPGRKPIQTFHYYYKDFSRIIEGIKSELSKGRQVYIVYPLIKENERMDLLDLERGYNQLVEILPQYKIGQLHGKMKPIDKEEAMQRFAEGETQVLVATTVIEVGVNVPNASVMVIQHADRFGLAQLHQLRGRVGRGAEKSYCILLTNYELSENTRRRMQIMVETTDGFVIAEEDLKLRGPGDLEGTAQSGLPFNLKVANLTKDVTIMEQARHAATRIIETDPLQSLPAYQNCYHHLKNLKKQYINYADIS